MSLVVDMHSTTEEQAIVDINMTPLIDVMLVLLIMFIITIPLQTQSVAINLPQGNPPPPKVEVPVVTLSIDFDNSLSWNGKPITSEEDLQAHLSQIAVGPEDTRPEFHIQPNRLASYKTVVHVMAGAQRLGVTDIGITGQAQFVEQ